MATRGIESRQAARKPEPPRGLFQKILVCSDGSYASLQAARLAALLAGKLQAQTLFLQVFDPSPAPPSSTDLWKLCPADLSLDQYIQQVEDTVEQRALPFFEQAGIPCEPSRAEGNPVEQIVHLAQMEKADLIVMGARGLGEWQAISLGSVSQGVLQHAPCPVLIARGQIGDIHQILLCTNGSPSAQHATAAAIQLARACNARLVALNVCEALPECSGQSRQKISARTRKRALEFVAEGTEQLLENAAGSVNIRQEVGRPAEVIVRLAEEEGFDLIVLGSRGLGKFRRLLLGSVSEQVAQLAKESVLIVR